MIEITHTDVYGWEAAVRGMRNPMNSWDRSDSYAGWCEDAICTCPCEDYVVGDNDLTLMKKLSKAGSDHAKYKRMINVTCDIIAPLYWWSHLDTYKVGTVSNSCSKMHKIHEKEFTINDFSCEYLLNNSLESSMHIFETVVAYLNAFRDNYLMISEELEKDMEKDKMLELQEKRKKWWWQMIQLLPSSYNQKRTVQLNYEVLTNIYHARKNHKLDEWREFCKWIETLPHSELITGDDIKDNKRKEEEL